MKFARLLIAAVVLAGLGGLVYWSNRSEEAKAGKPDPKAAPKILELKEADVKQIEIRHHDGETIVLKMGDGSRWSITAPQPLAADQAAVASITSAVVNLSSDRLVDDKRGQSSVLWPGSAAPQRDLHHGGWENAYSANR